MQVGDNVALSLAGGQLNKNKIISSGGVWEGVVQEIRGETYIVQWTLSSGRSKAMPMIVGTLDKHARNELKFA